MAFRFPWQKEPEPVAAPPTVEQIRAVVSEEVTASIERIVSDSPALIAPQMIPLASKYPLYGLDNPYTWAVPQSPSRRPQSLVSVATLRNVADQYDVMRDCIQHLKREVLSVPIEVVALDDKDDSRRTLKAIADCKDFLNTKGGLGGPGTLRSEHESKLIDDLCVVGVSTTWYHKNLAGGIYEALTIDAGTIRPRMDAFGWPGPDEFVFEQWVMGILIRGFTREELDFRGMPTNSRTYTPYPASPVEWLLNVVNSALRADDWNRRWLTDGNSSSQIIGLPETWTPDMIKEFAEFWDSYQKGDSAQRQKTRFMPGAAKPLINNSRKDQDFQEFELWLMRRTCACMGVQPASIGFAGEQYKVSQDDSMQSTSQFGAGVLLDFRKTYYDDCFQRMGYDTVQAKNIIAREEKATERAERNFVLVGAPVKTINEARQDEGLEKLPDGDTLLVPTTLQPIDMAGMAAQAAITAASQPAASAQGAQNAKGAKGNPAGKPAAQTAKRAKAIAPNSIAGKDSSASFNSDGSVSGTPKIRIARADATDGHWVTINGQAVLIGTDGQPASPQWKARLNKTVDSDKDSKHAAPKKQSTPEEKAARKAAIAAKKAAQTPEQKAAIEKAKQDRAVEKAARVVRVMGKLPTVQAHIADLRNQVATDLAGKGLSKERVGAVVTGIMDATTMRVGSEQYATKSARGAIQEGSKSQDSFGASSLRKSHVTVSGDTVTMTFPGKSRKDWSRSVSDPALAKAVTELKALPGDRLMQTQDANGTVRPFTETHTNAYMAPHSMTPKNLRTYHASRIAHEVLVDLGPANSPKQAEKNIRIAAIEVSNTLGNTPAMALQSYINPAVLDDYRKQST